MTICVCVWVGGGGGREGVILDISRIVSRDGHIRTKHVIKSKLTVSITVHDVSHCTFKEGQAKMKLYKTRSQKLDCFLFFRCCFLILAEGETCTAIF